MDHAVLESYLDQIQIGFVGESTAIGDAIATGVKRLAKSKAKSRIMILLTDGESNAGSISPLKAAEIAAQQGIKIYTIAVGTNGQVPILVQGVFGRQRQLVEVSVDEETLRKIAETTAGHFYQATDTEGLNHIYATIDELEKTKFSQKTFAEYHELYWKYVFAALIFLICAWGLQRTVFLRIP
jgi:Ca-activated chloride channel family protein